MPEKLGEAVLELTTDAEKLKDGLDQAKQYSKKFLKDLGDKFTKAGKTLSIGLTAPLVAGFTLAIKEAGEQEKAMADLADAIRTTGREGQISAGAIGELAGELQKTTLFTDGATIAAAALVQRFANLDQEGLLRVIPSLQNMSSVMGTDLQTAAMQLGKFIDGATDSLGRYKVPVEEGATQSERLASAVAFMDEKFAGAAKTAAETGLGPLVTLKNSFLELAESFGTVILPVVQRFADWLKGIIGWLQGMDEGTRKTIITIGLMVAAIGPLLLIGGQLITAIISLISIIKGVGGVMSIVSAGPIGIIILAVAALALGVYLLIKNWDTVKEFFVNLWEVIKDAFQSAIAFIKDIFGKVVQWMWENAEYLALALGPLGSAAVLIIKNWDAIEKFFKDLWAGVRKIFSDAVSAITGFAKQIYQGVYNWLVDKFQAVVDSVKESLDKVKGFFSDLFQKVVGRSIIPELVTGVLREFGRMATGTERLASLVATTLTDAFTTMAEGIGEAIVAGASGWEVLKEAAKAAISAILQMLGKEFLIRALAALALFNFVAAGLWTAASIAAFAAASWVKSFAGGGWITEPVIGVGQRTGGLYTLAETGPEYVSPRGGRGGGAVVLDIHDNIVAGSTMREFALIIRRELEGARVLGV